MQDSPTYHHGDLPNALLAAVGDIVEENGVANVSLREAARRAGVSHSAPAHHFGDKEGMLAAFAERGFDILASEMAAHASQLYSKNLESFLGLILSEDAKLELDFEDEIVAAACLTHDGEIRNERARELVGSAGGGT